MMRLIIVGVLAVLLSPVSPLAARDAAQVRAFRKLHACPATLKTTGPCFAWVVDHAWPLACGGPDEPWNMAWQAKAESYKKDVLERRICRNLKKGQPK